jgi:hypothetical protein
MLAFSVSYHFRHCWISGISHAICPGLRNVGEFALSVAISLAVCCGFTPAIFQFNEAMLIYPFLVAHLPELIIQLDV